MTSELSANCFQSTPPPKPWERRTFIVKKLYLLPKTYKELHRKEKSLSGIDKKRKGYFSPSLYF